MRIPLHFSLVSLFSLVSACRALPHAPPRTIVHDIHSFSEPNRVRVTHAALDLTLDFAEMRVFATAASDAQRIAIEQQIRNRYLL